MKNSVGPYMKSSDSTRLMMMRLVLALLPIVLFSFYKNGILPYYYHKTDILGLFYPLLFVLISTFSTFFFEAIYGFVFLKKRKIEFKKFLSNSYGFIPGLFLGLILPINTPISILILGSFVASIVGKMLFGGFGQNIFNPALIGRLFIISTYAIVISSHGGYMNAHEVDTISGATPLSNVATISGIGTYEEVVAPYGSLWDFFVGTIPGAVGETSALLCIVAFFYLAITKTIKWRIPVFYVLTVFVIAAVIGILNGQGVWYPLFAVMSGGLLFGAVFMATDPVTSPTTMGGQVLYGLSLGLLTVVFRYLTPYPEGVLTSILTMNMFVFILEKIGIRSQMKKNILLYPILILVLLLSLTTYGVYKKYKVDKNITTDPNFSVVSSNKSGDDILYVVTQKGYSGIIKGQIIINNGKIRSIEILEQTDSFYQKIVDSNYINQLLNGQDFIDSVDTVSGATITSNALKKMVINTLSNYGDVYE